MSTNHELLPEAESPLGAPSARSARVLQLHAACLLLSEEQPKIDEAPPVPGGPTRKSRAHDLLRAVLALLVAIAGLGGLVATFASRSPVHKSSDLRLGARSDDAKTTDALYDPDRGEMLIATSGAGVHTLRLSSGFWDQLRPEATGGLLSGNVVRMGRGTDRRTYFLSEIDRGLALSSVDLNRDDWRTHVGVTRFPELMGANAAQKITGVAEQDGNLWVATDRAGLGIYDPKIRGWKTLLRAKSDELLDDRVRDLTKGPDGSLWLATGSGINRFHAGSWQRFTKPTLAGADIRRLIWEADELWYVTARGGLGKFDGTNWTTLVGEGSWGEYGDADVKLACLDPVRDRIWLMSNDRVGCYDRKTRTWVHNLPAPPGANAIAAGTSKDQPILWAATQNGVWSLKEGAANWTGPSLPDQNALSVDVASTLTAVAIAGTDKFALPSAFVSGGSEWKKLTGNGKVDIGPAGLLSACLDPTEKQLLVGTEKGLSVYDLATRDWVGNHKIPGAGEGSTSIIDLQRESDRILGLTGDHVVRSFDPQAATWKTLSGGGRFPGNMADVTAVTRDREGRLWMAAKSKGLHRYNPKTREWADLATKVKDFSQLAASSDRVWALANGTLYMADGDKEPQVANLPPMIPMMKPTRLFAATDSSGVVLLDDDGRVVHIRDEGTSAIIVGAKAEGLINPKLVKSVGLLGDVAVLGGPNPHRYDALSRTWTKLDKIVGDVKQIVTSQDQFWLLNTDGKVFSVGTTGQAVDVSPLGGNIQTLAGASKQLVAHTSDNSVLEWNEGDRKWRIARWSPNGPKPEILRDPKLVYAVDGQDFYLAGAGGLWHFSWTNQHWREILDPDSQSLRTVEELVVAQRRSFMRVGKKVYSFTIGDKTARLEQLADIERITVANDRAVAVASGAAYMNAGDKWSPSPALGSANGGIREGDAPKDAIHVPDTGILFTGTKGSAILAPGFATWKPITGGSGLTNLQSAGDDKVWGVNEEGKLYVARNQAGSWKWEAVTFPGNASIASLSANSGTLGKSHWATTKDNQVYQLLPGVDPKAAWRSPKFAPGTSKDLVGVVETSNGFLAAFKTGDLAQFHSGTRTWSQASKVARIKRLFAVKSQTSTSLWILGENGELLVSFAGKDWQVAGKDLDDAVVAGGSLITISKPTGILSCFEIVDDKVRVVPAGGAMSRELAALKIAGEIQVAADRTILVLADDNGLLAYDPDLRSWTQLDIKLVDLHPLKASLVGRTASGIVHRVTWDSGKLVATKLDLGGGVLQLATDSEDRIVAQQNDGRIVLHQPDGKEPQQVTGPFLPKPSEGSKIVGVAGVGRQLFLGTTDGAYVYEVRSGWQVIPNVSSVKKIRSAAGAGWVQLDKPGGSLLRLVEKDGKWTSVVASENVRGWHTAPGGVNVQREKDGKLETIFITDDGMARVIHTPTQGPFVEEVAGDTSEMRVTSDGKFIYAATAKGVIVRDIDRKIVAIHSPDGVFSAIRWANDPTGQSRLFVQGAKSVQVLNGDKLEESNVKWETLSVNELEWNGQRYKSELDKDPSVLRLAPVSAKTTTQILDLNERGFHSDRVSSIGLAAKSSFVWVASPGQLRVHSPVAGQSAKTFALSNNAKPEMKRLGNRLIARAGTSDFELEVQMDPKQIALTDAEKSDLQSRVVGQNWRVDANDTIGFRPTSASPSHDLGFNIKTGFAADIATRIAVSKKTVVIATAKGTFLAVLRDNLLPKLSDLKPIEEEKASALGEPEELLAVDEVFYARTGTTWFQLANTPLRWVALKEQPKTVGAAKSALGGSTAMRWTRTGEEVQLHEPGPDGSEISTNLVSTGENSQFEFDRVRSALETDKGVWLATDHGVWLTDIKGTNWKPKYTRKAEPKAEMKFRRYKENWFLGFFPANVSKPSLVLKIDGDTIKAATDEEHPFQNQRILVDAKTGFRVSSDNGTLTYELRDNDGKLHVVKYLPDQGRFDFQAISDGVGKDKLFLAEAGGKTFEWTVEAGGMSFSTARADPKLPAPSVQAASDRWLIGKVGTEVEPTIRVVLNKQPVKLPLHVEGDFEYRRASKFALSEKDGAWSATDRAVVRHESGVPWVPRMIWETNEIAANRKVKNLISDSGKIHVSLDLGLYTHDTGKWQPAVEEKSILSNLNSLAASSDAIWKVGPDDKLRVERRLKGGTQSLIFDSDAKRFVSDQVADAGLWNGSLWLLSSQGLARVAPDTRQTIGQVNSDAIGWKNLYFDRENKRLLASGANGDVGIALSAEAAGVKTEVIAKNVIARHRGADYADADWRFVLGTTSTVQWRSLPSDLSNGLFAHDRFSSMFADGKDVWTSTPAGILKHSLSADELQISRVLPLPVAQSVFELTSVGGTIRCLGPKGEPFEWDEATSTWKTVAASRRTLVDTPLWSWSRSRPGGTELTFKLSDQPIVDSPLTPEGRFVHDGASAVLADSDAVWLAPHAGIVRQGVDGSVQRWYRNAERDGKPVALGRIVRLGRFDQSGNTIPSSATVETLSKVDVFALDSENQVWKFRQNGVGTWMATSTNPWLVIGEKGTQWLVRSQHFGAYRDRASVLKLHQPSVDFPEKIGGPVLSNGRMRHDVAYSIAHQNGRSFVATSAGLTEINPNDGSLLSAWRRENRLEDNLISSNEIFVHPRDGGLYASSADATVIRLDAATNRWAAVAVDEEFRSSADVRHRDHFWAWHRWNGRVEARLLAASPAAADWSLLSDGRFSFDVIRDIRVEDKVWAITDGGVARFRSSDMTLEWLDRSAVDRAGLLASIDAERFVDTKGLVCSGNGSLYAKRDNQWVRTTGSSAPDLLVEDGNRHWLVAPMFANGKPDGFDVTLREGESVIWKRHVLSGTEPSRLRSAVVVQGRLWICLDRGVYRITP